jgi:hypothetical protein
VDDVLRMDVFDPLCNLFRVAFDQIYLKLPLLITLEKFTLFTKLQKQVKVRCVSEALMELNNIRMA